MCTGEASFYVDLFVSYTETFLQTKETEHSIKCTVRVNIFDLEQFFLTYEIH